MSNQGISVVCPSRGRPLLAKRMIDSLLKDPGVPIEILLYLNDNDPLIEQYKELLDPNHYEIGVDRSPVYSWNELAKKSKYDIVFLMGDDAVVDTPNWGNIILGEFNKYPDKIVLVSPKAGDFGTYKCPHFFLHKNWINTLGYFVPPFFHHHYIDYWVRDLATSIKRYVHLPDFVMPIISNVGDETITRYTNSWLITRDKEVWEITNKYKTIETELLRKFINNYKGI
jgi:hypothetical protein